MRANRTVSLEVLEVPLERDVFLRSLVRELARTLQNVVGLKEAAGFISVVGQTIGDQLNTSYKAALGVEQLSREQVAAVLVDLKRRIQGDFYVIETTEEQIVLGNRVCPFGDEVLGRPALCMKRVRRHCGRESGLRKSGTAGDHRARSDGLSRGALSEPKRREPGRPRARTHPPVRGREDAKSTRK